MTKQKSSRQAKESYVEGSLLTADVAVDDVAAVVRSVAVVRMVLGSVASVSVRFVFDSDSDSGRSRTRGSGMCKMSASRVIRVSVDNCKTEKKIFFESNVNAFIKTIIIKTKF